MKYFLIIIVMALHFDQAMAQIASAHPIVKNSVPYPIYITETKTSSIVFPFDIVSVDRGRKDLMVQKAKGVSNILLLKASRPSFPETNLTVITADGKLYPFVVNYSSKPDSLHLSLGITHTVPVIATEGKESNIAIIQETLELIKINQDRNTQLKANRYGITVELNGLYTQGGIMYFQFSLLNNSNIDYNTASFAISLSDKKQRKRTARQVIPIKPIAINGNYEFIKGKSTQTFIAAVPKFTIPDKKKCIIQLMEKNGGRNITIKVGNATIIKAEKIPTAL